MIKNIKQKNSPCRRPFLDHIHIFSKSLIIISLIDWRVCITFNIVVERNFLITYYFFKIIPRPFFISRPFLSEARNDEWFFGQVIFVLEMLRFYVFNCIYGM